MGHYVWDIDPVLIAIGPLTARYYGLLFGVGILVSALLVGKSLMERGKTENEAIALLLILILGGVVGARLGHILFYHPAAYIAHPIRIVQFWEGGLASHGGAIGLFLVAWLYVRGDRDLTLLLLGDCLAIGIAFMAFAVRLGNFFNSEILGKPSDVPWAIVFARVDAIPRHPAMLYESLSYLLLFLILLYFFVTKKELGAGAKTGMLLVWVFASRFLIEFSKESQAAFELVLPLNMGQFLSIPFLIVGVFLLVKPHAGGKHII